MYQNNILLLVLLLTNNFVLMFWMFLFHLNYPESSMFIWLLYIGHLSFNYKNIYLLGMSKQGIDFLISYFILFFNIFNNFIILIFTYYL